MAELLYVVEKECPLCGGVFSTTRVRNSLQMIKQDTDFCTYYKEVNPYYYTIWLCSHCGYAAQDTYFCEALPTAAAEKLRGFLKERHVQIDLGGLRSLEQAITSYKLAIFYAEMVMTLSSRLAGLCMKLAWLYRESNQVAEERVALTKALEYYEKASLKERLPIGGLTELSLQFLRGELFRRTGNLEEACIYLGRLVSNPRARSEKRIFELARQCWFLAKEEKQTEEGSLSADNV